jgi:hypothetical protein
MHVITTQRLIYLMYCLQHMRCTSYVEKQLSADERFLSKNYFFLDDVRREL